MSNTNTGVPAFPVDEIHDQHPCGDDKLCRHMRAEQGMTLRDYFAAKAMGGMCTGAPLPQKNELDLIARRSYEMADAMMRARES